MTTRTLARLFDDYSDAAAAVKGLEEIGLSREDISIVANRDTAAKGGVIVAGTQSSGGMGKDHIPDTAEIQPGMETGATIGSVVGGSAGLAAGLGTLAIPGLGPIVAAGWLVAALTGAGVGAAAGSILGALTGAGVRETESHVYAEGLRRGSTLVTVRADDSRVAAAELVFQRHGAVVTQERGDSWRAAGWQGYDESASIAGHDDPPGTMASRGFDEVAGTNISGAHPENDNLQGRRSIS